MRLLKKTILRLGFLAGLLCSLCFVGEVKAVKCSDLLSYQNQNSVAYACGKVEQYPWEARGTLWLNDSSSEYNTESWVRVSAAQMKAGGKVKIYLHGAILNGYSAYAEYIKLVKVNYTIWGNADNYSNYAPLSNVPSRMWRVGNPYPFDYDIESSVNNQVVLDAKKLLALEKNTNNCSTSGRKTTCKIRLEAFRCYQGRGTQSSSCYEDGSCYCYSDKSFLNVEIEEPEPEPALFEGRAEVHSVADSSRKKDTGFVRSNATAGTLVATSAANKQVQFNLSLRVKDTNGANYTSGKTNYVIKRTESVNGVPRPTTTVESSSVNLNTGGTIVYSPKETVEPGNEVCYSIEFVTKVGGSGKAVLSVCAATISDDITSLVEQKLSLQLRNLNASSSYQNWQDGYVYAKPGDSVDFAGEFDPGYQYLYSYKASQVIKEVRDKMQAQLDFAAAACPKCSKSPNPVDGINKVYVRVRAENDTRNFYHATQNVLVDGISDNDYMVKTHKLMKDSDTVGSVFNNIMSKHNLNGWQNAFTIYLNDDNYGNVFGTKGSKTKYNNKSSQTYSYEVKQSDVGKKKAARALLNQNDSVKNTPVRIERYFMGQYVLVEIMIGNKSDCKQVDTSPGWTGACKNARAWEDEYYIDASSREVFYVTPYNFKTKATISDSMNGAIVHAGEVKTIPYGAEVINKANALTTKHGTESEGYATVVPETRCGLEVSYDGINWTLVDEVDGGSISPSDKGSYSANLPINDAPGGSKVYVRSYVWPASSGSDDNLSADGFTGTAYSEVIELNIAKKPSFQVWGGSVYSNGDIDLGGYTVKGNLAGYDGNYMFGSWTELSLQVNGTVKGLASGAGLGYVKDSNGNVFPSPYGNNSGAGNASSPGGGAVTGNLCTINTLSFRNDECSEGKIGSSGISLTSKDNLVSMLDKIDDSAANATGLGLDCAEKTCNLAGGTLVTGVKAINKSDANITITGNIYYGNGEERTLDSTNLPKLFIYANNITIDCSVEEINAVLIADGYVDTCKTEARDGYDETHKYNHPDNSHQLKINGSVIANKLKLNRTYGAGAGVNSIVPAEIINYDPTLYVWGIRSGSGSEVGGGGLESGTYMREVAPRY